MTAGDSRLADLRRLHLLSDPEAGSALTFPVEREAASAPGLRSVTAEELLSLPLPQREHALAPALSVPGLTMCYAPRGLGKTFLALSVALAVASGGQLLRWRAPKPRRVLYVDGEMPAGQMQERVARLIRAADAHPPEADFLRFVSADLAPEGLPSFADGATQDALDRLMNEVGSEVLILDNLSTLVTGLRENEGDDWADFQAWLLSQRRAGRCVLIVHHAGKGRAATWNIAARGRAR